MRKDYLVSALVIIFAFFGMTDTGFFPAKASAAEKVPLSV